jgi:Cof subfamily protein (haloacid dehalogenase superfamily)
LLARSLGNSQIGNLNGSRPEGAAENDAKHILLQAILEEKMSLRTIKAVALDVDGTLLDSDHRLRDDVKNALSDLVENDLQVILATARGPKILAPVLRLLPISPLLVCFSGAWVGEIDREFNPTREFLNRRHSMAVARSIVAQALELNVEPNVLTVNTWRARKMTREIMLESQIAECSPLITSDLFEDGVEPNKILLITGEEESKQPLQAIADSMRSVCNAAFSKPNYLEVVPLGVDKAEALRQLTAILGLELSQVAAIGDGLNDIEMLREAGLGIAMGNAPEAVKSEADWVTGTNNEGGVAQAVWKLLLGDLI